MAWSVNLQHKGYWLNNLAYVLLLRYFGKY